MMLPRSGFEQLGRQSEVTSRRSPGGSVHLDRGTLRQPWHM